MSTVLIITKNYPPAICGVGDYCHHLQQALEAKGHSVFIFTATREAAGDSVVVAQEAFGPAMYAQLATLISELRITHFFWQYVPYSFQAKGMAFWWPGLMKKLKRRGIKQLIFFHEVSIRMRGYGSKRGLLACMQRIIANRALYYADRGFTNIPLYRHYFIGKKPEVVPVGSNMLPPAYLPAIIPGQVLCFANRADEALFIAFKKVISKVNAHLVLCGAVAEDQVSRINRWLSKAGLEKSCLITGPLGSKQLAEVIASSQVVIQPQVVERGYQGGISAKNGTIMAAMCMGKPIITCEGDMTDPAIFKDRENMWMVQYGDADQYADALSSFLNDAALAKNLGLAAAATYYAHCDWPQIAHQITFN